MSIVLKRIYEEDEPLGGYRVLVDGVWPRGISKEDAQLDEWARDLAPSSSLRKWFNHEKEKFESFKQDYKQELDNPRCQEIIEELRGKGKEGRVVLLYGAKEKEYNHATVLKDILTTK